MKTVITYMPVVSSSLLLMSLALIPCVKLVYAQQPDTNYPGLIFTTGSHSQPLPTSTPGETASLSLTRTARELEEEYERIFEYSGPFEEENIEALTNLAASRSEAEDYTGAIGDLESALQVARIQYGLESDEQLPIIESLIENHLELRQFEEADNMHALLLHIAINRFQPGSDILGQARLRNARWNSEYFKQYYLYLNQPDRVNRGDALVEIYRQENSNRYGYYGNVSVSGFSATIPNPCSSLSLSPAPFNSSAGAITTIRSSDTLSFQSTRINEAEQLYESVLNKENSPQQTDARLDAALQLASIRYLREYELNLYRRYLSLPRNTIICASDAALMTNRHYREGQDLLEQRLMLLQGDNRAYTEIAQAMLDLADWDLVFNNAISGKNKLEELHAFLLDHGQSSEEADAFINAETPVMLPTFIDHQYSQRWADDSLQNISGHIEVDFTINYTGKTFNIHVTDYSENAEYELRSILRNHIRDSTFRPHMVEGKVLSDTDMHIRYDFTY